jgi:hypothetical protein
MPDFEFPISAEINNTVESRNFPHWADQETYNFFSLVSKLVTKGKKVVISISDNCQIGTHVGYYQVRIPTR